AGPRPAGADRTGVGDSAARALRRGKRSPGARRSLEPRTAAGGGRGGGAASLDGPRGPRRGGRDRPQPSRDRGAAASRISAARPRRRARRGGFSVMQANVRGALRALLIGAAGLLVLHLVSILGLFPAWRQLTPAAQKAVEGISPTVVRFQLAVGAGICSVGAAFGLAAWAALRALRVRAGAGRVLAGSLLIAAACVARAVAHKPALFEDVLWRQGGVRAWLQVLLAERIGIAAPDRALLAIA